MTDWLTDPHRYDVELTRQLEANPFTVYRFFDVPLANDPILKILDWAYKHLRCRYIGQTSDPIDRFNAHMRNGLLTPQTALIITTRYSTREEALAVEKAEQQAWLAAHVGPGGQLLTSTPNRVKGSTFSRRRKKDEHVEKPDTNEHVWQQTCPTPLTKLCTEWSHLAGKEFTQKDLYETDRKYLHNKHATKHLIDHAIQQEVVQQTHKFYVDGNKRRHYCYRLMTHKFFSGQTCSCGVLNEELRKIRKEKSDEIFTTGQAKLCINRHMSLGSMEALLFEAWVAGIVQLKTAYQDQRKNAPTNKPKNVGGRPTNRWRFTDLVRNQETKPYDLARLARQDVTPTRPITLSLKHLQQLTNYDPDELQQALHQAVELKLCTPATGIDEKPNKPRWTFPPNSTAEMPYELP